jgi:thioesterase domain-containing protein
MRDDSQPSAQYLQDRITAEITLARHMGVVVERAGEFELVLCAPLERNDNHKGTAFGGSLYSLAVLTGWAWVTRYLAVSQVDADAVIQESTIRYVAPVRGPLRASLVPPAATEVERFARMLRRSNRGRIRLEVVIRQGRTVATEFAGTFAAMYR